MINPTILFEDNHIIAVNKPPGWLVQGDATLDLPLSEWVKQYLKDQYQKPGKVYLGVLHRIDRPVSGIVLFSKTSKSAERMSKAIQHHEVKKYYTARVKGKPAKEFDILEHYLLRIESNNTVKTFMNDRPGSKYAKLEYRVNHYSAGFTYLDILLYTGRHHQIRAQLSSINLPIVGDLKYGYPFPNKDGSIDLHASKIIFMHPVKKEMIQIESIPGF